MLFELHFQMDWRLSRWWLFSPPVLLVALLPRLVPAPVPRCSPLYKINKLVESTNIFSDSNPYFPVPPCEYGGPIAALKVTTFSLIFRLHFLLA